jgi:DNA polymerase-3 subunit epsilon
MKSDLAEVLALDRPLVVFDLETTGIGKEARIVQIAGEKIDSDGTILHSFCYLINPECPIPEDATAIHNITDEDVADKPTFADLAPRLFEIFSGSDLAGFNIITFDVPLLVRSFKECGFELNLFQTSIIDAMTIFHKHYKRDLNAAHQTYCGSSLAKAHDALSDVQATVRIMTAQLRVHEDVPKDIQVLHEYCDQKPHHFVDAEGRLKWVDRKATFSSGRFRGKTLEWVHRNHNWYLWDFLKRDVPKDLKDVIHKVLVSKEYPTY